MERLKNILILSLLIIMTLLTLSCSNDNSITGYSDYYLEKTTNVIEINSRTPFSDPYGPGLDGVEKYMAKLISWIFLRYSNIRLYAKNYVDEDDRHEKDNCLRFNFNEPNEDIDESIAYDFRDNYLLKSEKGEVYTACYYLLSKYSIENNLVNKYYKEHYELLKSSFNIAHDLQYGDNFHQILIEKEFSEKLENMLEVYGNHENHREIEPVLDYLEFELHKYKNQPKYVISEDFKK